ncbi:MAG TPA: hypothetical protein VFL57_13905 [Bryobacteraceae bacterium]|nr:hypothetical protein [Bryobacteraceae bacterium]
MERRPEEPEIELQQLAAQVREIERRLTALERRADIIPAEAALPAGGGADTSTAAVPTPAVNAGVIPILGRALLGIAGAYLLRAIAESGAVPPVAAAITALAYAGFWLFSSTRAGNGHGFNTTAYGLTAAMILAPMLWETTVRFQVLSPALTASLLVCFVIGGSALAWPRNLTVVTTITTVAGVGTALALIFATHALVPFTTALLLIAIVIEYAACRDHFLGERWVVALTADLSILILTSVAARPQGWPDGYERIPVAGVIAMQIALPLIYITSIVHRTAWRRIEISAFEIAQAAAALAVSFTGILRVAPAGDAIGAFCVLAGAACYLIAPRLPGRNLHAYVTFGLLLVLAGTWLIAPRPVVAAVWSVLAIAAMWHDTRTEALELRSHAAAYLLAAAFASELLKYANDAMVGAATIAPRRNVGAIITAIAAAAAWAISGRTITVAARIPAAVIAGILCWATMGLIVAAAVVATGAANTPLVASIRTAFLCAAALLLPSAASRFRRPELLWLVYPLMGFGALKLVLDDFAHGRAATLALSLLCYGATLVMLPGRFRAQPKLM